MQDEKGHLQAVLSSPENLEAKDSGCFMHIPETLSNYLFSIGKVVELFENFLESELG
jgi:hypothetical protein